MRSLSDSEILLKAAFNRIAARITEKLINSAQELTEITEEMPQKLKDEWSTFKNEVIEESRRLEKKTNSTDSATEKNTNQSSNKEDSIQIQIDKLRAKVIETNKTIEEKN
tara:strand:- start:6854 stop:7183 length:330 start_codon:yes stop_codon:yes gene_type:complete